MEQVCNAQTTDRRSPSLTAFCHLKAEQRTSAEVVFVINPITELQGNNNAKWSRRRTNGCHLQSRRDEIIKRMTFLSAQDQMKSSDDLLLAPLS